MQYDQLRLKVRPRNPWEATDLGIAMTRVWWRDVYRAWFALTLPIFIAVNLLFSSNPGWALLLLWWLKPLYDRALLLVYSRKLFGQPASLRDVGNALPQVLTGSGLLLHLTLYRLDPTRSLRLPIWQLEGLRGKQRAPRHRILAQRAGGYAMWLMVVCVHLEAFLQLAVFGLIWLFTPTLVLESAWQQAWNMLSDSQWPYWVYLSLNSIYYLAVSAIEPLYVAGGFALYLNRRTQLEGWDLEITFRRIAQRLNASAQTLLLVCGLGVAATLLHSAPAAAQQQRLDPTESAQVIEQVLADKDFGGSRTATRWGLKDRQQTKKTKPKHKDDDISLPLLALSRGVEIALWIAFAVLGLYLLRQILRYRDAWPGRKKSGAPPLRRSPASTSAPSPCPTMSPPRHAVCGNSNTTAKP